MFFADELPRALISSARDLHGTTCRNGRGAKAVAEAWWRANLTVDAIIHPYITYCHR